MPYIVYRKTDLYPMSYSGTVPEGYTEEDEIQKNVLPNYGGVVNDYEYVEITDHQESERAGKAFGWIFENGVPIGIELMRVSADKPQITADGIDTATITATVDDPASTEMIELWNGDTLVDSEQTVNGQAQFQITMTSPGTLTLTVRSTTKYGQNSVTIEGV